MLMPVIRQHTSTQEQEMAHQHSPRFLDIVADAKRRIPEVTLDEVDTKLQKGEQFVLVDVREESEFTKDHIPGALHMGKGTIERDIERRVPDLDTPIVLYCGGGFRSCRCKARIRVPLSSCG